MAAFQKAISANPIRNAGMTVVYGGAIASNSPVTNAPGASLVGKHSPTHGAKVADNSWVDPIKSTGRFAAMTAGQYILLGNCSQIAGLASNMLRSQGNGFQKHSIHIKENQQTLKQITAGWNYATGKFLTTPSGSNDLYKSIDGGAPVDQAARPSRAVPGEFVYMKGSKTPYQDDYKAITGV